jgi:hypothetical protein
MTFKVEYFTLQPVDTTTNKYVNLSNTPADSTVALDVVGGTAQFQLGTLPGDFNVDGTKVEWAGLGLDGFLNDNDELRVLYDRT